jgi:AraC family transcriptional regulator
MGNCILRPLAAGKGWRVTEEVCGAGPYDKPFEEKHSRFSVSAVLSGSFLYHSDRGRALMCPGSLLVGNEGAAFCCSHEHTCGDRCVAFYLDDWWVEELAGDLPGVKSTHVAAVRIPPAQSLSPLISAVQTLVDCGAAETAEELAFRMAAAALTFSSVKLVQGTVSPMDEKKIAAAIRNAEQEIAAPLSLAHLSSTVGMSRYHFLRTFRRVTGQSPWQYLLSRRLALAARHLSTGKFSVLDAAVASGFTDLSEFTRRFRLHFGVTPGSYDRHRSPNRNQSASELSSHHRRLCADGQISSW